VSEIEALIKRGELDVKVYEGEISGYEAESRALLGLAQADSTRRQGVAALTQAGSERWKISYDAFNTYEQVGSVYARIRADIRMKETELELEAAKANLTASVEEARIISAEVLGKAQVYSHIAASEMSRFNFNLSNSIQASMSDDIGRNYSSQQSCSQSTDSRYSQSADYPDEYTGEGQNPN
jgi:hypothetical protein